MRMEPLRSLPIVSAPRPAATAAAPPPVDPPAVRVTSQGLFVVPYAIDPLKRQLEQFGRGNLFRANRERQPIGRRESRDEVSNYSSRTRPRRMATLIASVRLVTPSFSKRCPRCVLTVRSLIESSVAISLFALPSA